MFFGEKLQNVRELQGLSRKDLATRVGVTEQTIWQYENEYIEPKFEIVNKLKKVFNVKPQFFYSETFVTNVSELNHIAYRADDRRYRKKANMEIKYIDYVNYFIKTFEDMLNVKVPRINILRDKVEEMLYRDSKGIEDIALAAREFLEISSNKELLYKIELAGVNVLEKNMGNNVDAYSTWTTENKPFIILGSVRKSSVRRNFDLAHELGHLLLHRKVEMDNLSTDEYRKIEKEANNFASYFLLPKNEFIEDFSSIDKISNPNSYIELKMKYHVSIAALEYRAYKLGLLTFEENRYFYAKLNKEGMRQVEPLDRDIPIVKPGKIRALVDIVFKNHLLFLDDFLADYYIEPLFLEELLAFEPGFFNEYKEETKQIYYGSNVIQLPNQ